MAGPLVGYASAARREPKKISRMKIKRFTLTGVIEGLVYGTLIGCASLTDFYVHHIPKRVQNIKMANQESAGSEQLSLREDSITKTIQPGKTLDEAVSGEHAETEKIDEPLKQEETPLEIVAFNSPNYSVSRGRVIDMIVLHTTESTGISALNAFLNPGNNVSSHYLIIEDGAVYSFVREENTALHCRGYNKRSIGIELAGHYNRPLNPEQIESARRLIRDVQKRYGIGKNSIKPHSELDPSRRKDPGEDNFNKILEGI